MIARNTRLTLWLMIGMFAWNVGLSIAIVRQFRKLPGIDMGEQVEANRKTIDQLTHSLGSVAQTLELERKIREQILAGVKELLRLVKPLEQERPIIQQILNAVDELLRRTEPPKSGESGL